jgi:hypothetical protein
LSTTEANRQQHPAGIRSRVLLAQTGEPHAEAARQIGSAGQAR